MESVARGRLVILALVAVAGCAPAVVPNGSLSNQSLLEKADRAIAAGDEEAASYYLARFGGMAEADPSATSSIDDSAPIVAKLGLKPTAFISGRFSNDFLAWFFTGTYYMWASPENYTDENDHSTIVALSSTEAYYAGVKARPFIESWAIIGGPHSGNTYAFLIDHRMPPMLIVGDVQANQIILEYPLKLDGFIQHFWKPIIKDIDDDGRLEIVLRYNVARGNGFFQVCDVYQFLGDHLELLDSITGDPEGFARYISGNQFQSGRAMPSAESIGHLGFDLYEISTHRFVNKKFQLVGTDPPIEHILWSDRFQHYFGESNEDHR